MTDNSMSNDEKKILKTDDFQEENEDIQKDGITLKPKVKKNSKQKEHPISARIEQLATPRQMDPSTKKDLEYVPFQIKKADLQYRASRRIRKLAKPVVRDEHTVRQENVFQVKRSALKAYCSPRIQELAKPVHRSSSPFPTFRFYPDLEQSNRKVATVKNINGPKLTKPTIKTTKTKTAILAK